MIGIKTLSDCVDASIAGSNNSPLAILQLSSVSNDFDNSLVYSVANTASLPAAADNKGRMAYLLDTCSYRISDGTTWSSDFTSTGSNFQIWGAGCNRWGTLGTGDLVCRSSLVSVVGGFTDWCQVAQTGAVTFALRTNGTLWSWGLNTTRTFLGQNNTLCCQNSPITVVGGFTDWRQVSAGGGGGLGLRSNGTIWGWGYNGWGRIGDGTTYDRSSPVSIVGGITNWCFISAGYRHAHAIRTDGTLWTWGFNCRGQLGTNNDVPTCSPVTVVGGFTDWCQVSAGCDFTVALRSNGTLWSWGDNCGFGSGRGSLGDGTIYNRSSPVSVVGGFTDWCAISQGSNRAHTIAVRSNGTAWGWGPNNSGELGSGTTSNVESSPVSVIGGFTNWRQVAAGSNQSSGVRADGSLLVWGRNNQYGQFGTNDLINRSSPVQPVGGLSGWCQAAMGQGLAAIRAGKGF